MAANVNGLAAWEHRGRVAEEKLRQRELTLIEWKARAEVAEELCLRLTADLEMARKLLRAHAYASDGRV